MRFLRPRGVPVKKSVLAVAAFAWTCVALSTVGLTKESTQLSPAEATLQGTWKARSGWVLVFDGHTFSARSGTEWYQGSFSAPATDSDPAPLDLEIDDCGTCAYKGMTSRSIYRWEDQVLVLSGGTPGKSRPPIFDDTMGLILEMTRVTEAKRPQEPK